MHAKNIRRVRYFYPIYLLLFAAFLSTWLIHFNSLAGFGHDISRDIILNYKMYLYGEWIYRGPVFSVVWGYLSPVYYYLLFPFHYLSGFHPISSSVASIFFHFVGIILAVYFSKKLYGKTASVFTGILMGFSLFFTQRGFEGLNPSLMPPFAVLTFYSLYKTLTGNTKIHFSLLAFSLAVMIALHPTGIFWFLPIIFLYFLYRPKFSFKDFVSPVLIFGIVGILPYLIQEKKLNWWTIKQFVNYIKDSSGSEEANLTVWNYISNFIIAVSKNISYTLFNTDSTWAVVLGLIAVVFLVISAIKIFKEKNKYNYLVFLLVSYLLNFGLLVHFQDTDPNKKWFAAVFIPIFLIYGGVLLARVYHSRYWIISILAIFLFLTINLKAYMNYQAPAVSYAHQRNAAEAIREDSQGADFDIYGLNPEPTFYMMWYLEQDPDIKEKYFTWIKWPKEKDSKLVYFIQSTYNLEEEKIKDISDKHKLDNPKSEIIFTAGNGLKIYRIN